MVRLSLKFCFDYCNHPQCFLEVLGWLVSDLSLAAVTGEHGADFQPNWGSMNFLAEFLRPTAYEGSSSWFSLLKRGGGGCNDLIYSGHVLVAVLTAMAWTVRIKIWKLDKWFPFSELILEFLQEAYGGFTSAIIWMLVAHSAQREIRERHHYSVDCVVAIYMGIFLWKMVGLFWPIKDSSRQKRLDKLEKIQSRLVQAAKDSDMDAVRELLKEVELSSQVRQESSSRALSLFSGATILFTFVLVLVAFTMFSDGWF